MIKEIRDAWWDYISIIASQVVSFPLSLVYISFVTRKLGPEKWGIFTIFMSIIQLIFSLGINWTSNAVVRFGKEEFIREGHLKSTFWARTFIITIIILILSVGIFLLKRLLANYVGISERVFLLIIPMLVIYSAHDFLTWLLKAAGLMRQFALSSVLRQFILIFLVAIFFIKSASLSIDKIIGFEIMSYFLTALFCIFFLKFSYFFPFKKDIPQVKNILIYSFPVIFIFFFGYCSNWMDVYLIKYFLSNYDVGIYQVAYRMIYYFSIPLISFCTLLFPLLMNIKVQGRHDIIQAYIKRVIPQFCLAWNILISILILISGFTIKTIFGMAYEGAALSFAILLFGLGFQGLSLMCTSIFSVFDKLKDATFIVMAVTLVNLIGDVIFIPKIGISGAAIATAFSYVAGSILYLHFTNKLVLVSTYKSLFAPLLSAISLILFLGIHNVPLRILSVLATIITFLAIARAKKVFSPYDISLLEKVEMPDFLIAGIKKIYRVLS